MATSEEISILDRRLGSITGRDLRRLTLLARFSLAGGELNPLALARLCRMGCRPFLGDRSSLGGELFAPPPAKRTLLAKPILEPEAELHILLRAMLLRCCELLIWLHPISSLLSGSFIALSSNLSIVFLCEYLNAGPISFSVSRFLTCLFHVSLMSALGVVSSNF